MSRLANFSKIFLVCCFLMSTMIVKNAFTQTILPDVFSSCPVSEGPFPTEFSIQQRWATPDEVGRRTLPYQTPIVSDLFGDGQPVVVVPADNNFNIGASVFGRRATDFYQKINAD